MKISFRWKIQPTFYIAREIYDMHTLLPTHRNADNSLALTPPLPLAFHSRLDPSQYTGENSVAHTRHGIKRMCSTQSTVPVFTTIMR